MRLATRNGSVATAEHGAPRRPRTGTDWALPAEREPSTGATVRGFIAPGTAGVGLRYCGPSETARQGGQGSRPNGLCTGIGTGSIRENGRLRSRDHPAGAGGRQQAA
jgi:hypothetical protein